MPAAPQDGMGHPATTLPGLQAIPPRLRYRVIAASTIGNAFEWFDFTVFGLFTIIISRQFFPAESSTNSLLLGTATLGIAFFFRPIGGIVFGLYADRMGRKSAVANMVLLMALGSADSVASLVMAGTVPASRPLAPATAHSFAAARPAFGNRYFARFPPPWLYAPARPSHHADAVLRPLGLPQALRLGASRLPWLIA